MARPLSEVLADPEVLRGIRDSPDTFRFPDGALVTVTAVQFRPHIIVTEDDAGNLQVSGPFGNVLNVLAQALNFTYKIMTTPDRAWGAQRLNGSWTGMVGQVNRKEVDVGLGPFGFTYNRTKIVDFTESLFFDPRGLLSSKGKPEIDPWGFLHPLTGSVWAAVAAAMVVAWLVTMMVGRHPRGAVSLGWAAEVLLQNVRIFLNQGLSGVVLGHGGSVMLASWVVVAAVVFWSYTGTLTSLLAVRHISQPIQSLRDLLDDPSVSVIMLPMTMVTDAISKMKSGEMRELHELKYVGRVRYEPTKAFQKMLETVVRHDRYTILETTLALDLLIAGDFLKTNRCDFYKARQTFFTTSHCVIAKKGNPLVPAFNNKIRALVESGLYVHWLMNEIPAITTCRYSPSNILVQESLSLSVLWGMFTVFGAGHLLATIVFCMEVCLARGTRNRP